MNVSAKVTIARPTSDVFAHITDVANMPRWVSGVSGARLISSEMGPDARFVCSYTSAFRPNDIELQVTSYVPSSAFGTKLERGPFAFEGTMSLVAVAGGTEVTNTIVVDPDSVATRLASVLFGWFVRPSMRKRLARELEALRSSVLGEEMVDAGG